MIQAEEQQSKQNAASLLQYKHSSKKKIHIYVQTSAPVTPGDQTSSDFYTHRTRTSTTFVKRSVKLHSVVCQLSYICMYSKQHFYPVLQKCAKKALNNKKKNWKCKCRKMK